MARQFDVYRNPSMRSNAFWPYYLILQHDYFDTLATRVIVPLVAADALTLTQRRVTPAIMVNGTEHYVFMPAMTFLEARKIDRRDFVVNLADSRNEILAAIDAIVTNA